MKIVTAIKYAPVAGFNGYRVGDDGSVWSRRKRGSGDDLKPYWTIMSGKTDPQGYRHVTLCDGRRGRTRTIHRLVLEAFVGPCPEGMECCHEDGDASNNKLTNLRWDIKASNMADQLKHGTRQMGARHALAKTNESDVRLIRQLHATGTYTFLSLAQRFGLSNVAVARIVKRKGWKHVE